MSELKKIFLPGVKIQIEIMNKQGEIDQLASQVDEQLADGNLEILAPLQQGKIVNLLNDTKIDIVLPKGDAIYRFAARIVSKNYKRISTYIIEPLSEVTKIQRRGYFRMKVIKEVSIKVVENLAEKQFGKPVKGTMMDLSGGGCLFTCPGDYMEGDLLELEFEMRGKMVAFITVVRRKLLNDINARYKHSYGVRFENFTDAERNEVSKFVFEEQRRLIKKGLI